MKMMRIVRNLMSRTDASLNAAHLARRRLRDRGRYRDDLQRRRRHVPQRTRSSVSITTSRELRRIARQICPEMPLRSMLDATVRRPAGGMNHSTNLKSIYFINRLKPARWPGQLRRAGGRGPHPGAHRHGRQCGDMGDPRRTARDRRAAETRGPPVTLVPAGRRDGTAPWSGGSLFSPPWGLGRAARVSE